MSDSANIKSLEAIKEFKVALAKFEEQARQALITAQTDIGRAISRMQNDYLAYWKHEYKRWERKLAEAKNELARLELQPRDQRPSAVVERKAIDRAEQNMRRAQDKVERVKRWGRELEKEADLCRGQLQQLDELIESDVPKAKAMVDRMLSELEQYVHMATPDTGIAGVGAEQSASTGGMGRSSTPLFGSERGEKDVDETVAHVPTIEQRKQAPALKDWPTVPEEAHLAASQRERLERLASQREPADRSQRIVVAPDAIAHSSLVLDRMAAPVPGDGGWFLGGLLSAEQANEAITDSYRSTTVGELIKHRPDLEPVFALPPGTQVRIDQGRVIAVYDTREDASSNESDGEATR